MPGLFTKKTNNSQLSDYERKEQLLLELTDEIIRLSEAMNKIASEGCSDWQRFENVKKKHDEACTLQEALTQELFSSKKLT